MSPPWMPLYIADYRVDTAHLGAAEHGAYLLLIMHYWQTGGLPDDDRLLARIACMSPAEWKRCRPIVQPFFYDGWRHKRIDSELDHAADVISKRRAAAAARHGRQDANAHANGPARAGPNGGSSGGPQGGDTRVSPSPSHPQPQEKQGSSLRSDSARARVEKSTPRSELASVLDDEHAAAVVEHRQRLGKPLTAYGARKLAGQFRRAQDPNAAADEMVAQGWQGFKPDWLTKAGNSRGPPRKGKESFASLLRDRLENDPPNIDKPS